jgi:hypothetical protein
VAITTDCEMVIASANDAFWGRTNPFICVAKSILLLHLLFDAI